MQPFCRIFIVTQPKCIIENFTAYSVTSRNAENAATISSHGTAAIRLGGVWF
jgi:hypothetical protein